MAKAGAWNQACGASEATGFTHRLHLGHTRGTRSQMDNKVRAGAHVDGELGEVGSLQAEGRSGRHLGEPEPRHGAQQARPGCTYTQIPGVQLHLLLQLCEQLVVKRLQLDMERKHISRQLQHMDPEQEAGQG